MVEILIDKTKKPIIMEGYIYILYNDVYKFYGDNVYKLGKTSNIKTRLSGYTTSYLKPSKFIFISNICNNYSLAEHIIFRILSNKRINSV